MYALCPQACSPQACSPQEYILGKALMPVLQLLLVTLSHLRSKEPPGLLAGLHTKLQLGSDYIDVDAEIDCGDQLILMQLECTTWASL